jgi:hypothetical protein
VALADQPITSHAARGREQTLGLRPSPDAAEKERNDVNQDINVLALVKGEERYVFLFDDASRAEALRVLGRFASNPELSFTWYDAAVMSQKIRQDEQQQHRPTRRFNVQLTTDSDEIG